MNGTRDSHLLWVTDKSQYLTSKRSGYLSFRISRIRLGYLVLWKKLPLKERKTCPEGTVSSGISSWRLRKHHGHWWTFFYSFSLTIPQEKVFVFNSIWLSLSNLVLCSAGRETQRGRKLQKTPGTASASRTFNQYIRKIASYVTS